MRLAQVSHSSVYVVIKFTFSFSVQHVSRFPRPNFRPPPKGLFHTHRARSQLYLRHRPGKPARPPTSQHAMPPFVHISVSSRAGRGDGVRAARPIACVLGYPRGRLAITAETVKIMCNHGERGPGVISDTPHKSCDCVPAAGRSVRY